MKLDQATESSTVVSAAVDLFQSEFGHEIEFAASAPGRVNLIGEHVDYNDGYVLPFAIPQQTVLVGAVRTGVTYARIRSSMFDDVCEIPLGDDLAKRGEAHWSNHVAGVIQQFIRLGHQIPAFDGVIHSDIPVGAGLSSSAALQVATATYLESLLGIRIDRQQKALLCQQVENELIGVPCGIMDQYISVFAEPDSFVQIDCQNLQSQAIHSRLDGLSFLVTNSMVSHQLADGKYAERRRESATALKKLGQPSYREATEDDVAVGSLTVVERKRARHIVSEIQRVKTTCDAIRQESWNAVGQLLYESHDSLAQDYEVSCDELDQLVDIYRSIGEEGGVLGARMTGGGFGGCTISIVETKTAESTVARVKKVYFERTGITPSIYRVRPSGGATILL